MSDTPPLPSIDSDHARIGARASRHIELLFRNTVTEPNAADEVDFYRVVTGEAHPLGNVVILPQREESSHIAEAIEPLVQGDFPSAVLFPGGVTPSSRTALLDAGFEDSGSMPAMAMDLNQLAATALPKGFQFARVGAGREGEEWADTLAVGYGLPIGVARLFSPVMIPADPADDAVVQFFAVKYEDRILATSLLYLADGLAGIYCVATLADARGQGLGAHVTAQALRAAERLGYRVGVLQSSSAGHPVYRRLGFQDVGGVPMFARVPT